MKRYSIGYYSYVTYDAKENSGELSNLPKITSNKSQESPMS